MFRKLLKMSLPVLIIVAAILVARGMIGSRAQLESGSAEQQFPRVQTLETQLGEVTIALVAHGTVTADVELEMASEVTGRVTWVSPAFEPGERVEAGAILLRIDPVNYALALAEAEASLAAANTALADAQALRKRAAITEANLNIKAVQQRILKARQDLAYTEIRAPFDAIIDRQNVEIGQFVTTGQNVARLFSTASAQVSLPFTPSQVELLGKPDQATVAVSEKLGEQQYVWPAKLLRIEARVDEATRVIPVVVEIEAPYSLEQYDRHLPVGSFVSVSISGKPIADAVRLPSSALQIGDSVYVEHNGELQRREVTIAYREGNTVVVDGGLETGEHVVLTRLDVMFEGMKVQRKTQEVNADD